MAKKLVFDKLLFTVIVGLTGLGLVMVYSASAALTEGRSFNPFLVKQALAAALGFGAMAALMHLDYRRLKHPAVVYSLVVLTLLLLTVVLFGPERNETQRWLYFGGISFQPSELAKVTLVLYLAYQIDRRQERERDRDLLVPALLVSGLMAALVQLEPDLGTVVVLAATALGMLYLAGIAWRFVFASVAAGGALVTWLILGASYRLDRVRAFLDPALDPEGINFQVNQSLIAIGSGGWFGRGPGNSLQKLHFLPQPHSDFIYSIVAEELGLIGAVAVLVLFGVFLWRGLVAAHTAPDLFGTALAFGLTGLVVLQALVNISVTLALLPTTGLPLPFLSSGGSSLALTLAASGVLLNVSQHG